MVNTVLGPISASKMGATLAHEHCFSDADTEVWGKKAEVPKKFAHLLYEPVSMANLDLVKRAARYSVDNHDNTSFVERVQEMNAFKAAGGRTVIDATPEAYGRNRHVHKLPQLSKLTAVNIVAATGQLIETTHPLRIKKQTSEQVAQDFIKEITEGIMETGIKAGVIKTALAPNSFTPADRKIIKAAAIAQKETGVPINTHTWGDRPGKWPGFKVIEMLQRNDVDPNKLYLSHMEWTENLERNWGVPIKAVAAGAYVCIDNFGRDFPFGSADNTWEDYGYIGCQTDVDRVKLIKRLIAEHYEDKIVVGHDSGNKVSKLAYGGPGMGHILDNVPILFQHLGINQKYFRKITVDNPRKLFS
jgi:phosphotriesterase-related protein